MKKNGDYLIIGEIGIIGLAEACHLAAVFLKLPFTVCALLFAASLGILAVACAGFVILRRRHAPGEAERKSSAGTPEKLLYGMFALMVISQLIFIGMGNAIYRKGDMMVETVGSLMASDSVYQVNPMTGMPYTEGMPLRLKILCLPTLYGSLCRWTGLPPALVVQRIVPMLVLVSAYVSFSLLGQALFPGDAGKRACFLLLVSLLVWTGAYRYGMDGFNLLCCGWRGVAIRGGVLLPWTLSLCLRRKRLWVAPCVLAEASIVWTFYGCGACLALAAGVTAAQLCCRRVSGAAANRRASRAGEKEDAR